MGKANKHKPFNKEAEKAYDGSLKHFFKTITPEEEVSSSEVAGPPTEEKQS